MCCCLLLCRLPGAPDLFDLVDDVDREGLLPAAQKCCVVGILTRNPDRQIDQNARCLALDSCLERRAEESEDFGEARD